MLWRYEYDMKCLVIIHSWIMKNYDEYFYESFILTYKIMTAIWATLPANFRLLLENISMFLTIRDMSDTEESQEVVWWLRWLARGVGSLAGISCAVGAILTFVFHIMTIPCIVAAVFMCILALLLFILARIFKKSSDYKKYIYIINFIIIKLLLGSDSDHRST